MSHPLDRSAESTAGSDEPSPPVPARVDSATGFAIGSPEFREWASGGQARAYESSGGREGAHAGGVPIIVLTTLGAKSGQQRKTALMRVEHGGEYLAVASYAGRPEHPAWYHNVVAHPRVWLQDGQERHEYVARELHGDERSVWWERATTAYPPYDEYQLRTDRVIPIFLLSRTE